MPCVSAGVSYFLPQVGKLAEKLDMLPAPDAPGNAMHRHRSHLPYNSRVHAPDRVNSQPVEPNRTSRRSRLSGVTYLDWSRVGCSSSWMRSACSASAATGSGAGEAADELKIRNCKCACNTLRRGTTHTWDGTCGYECGDSTLLAGETAWQAEYANGGDWTGRPHAELHTDTLRSC